MHRRQFFKSAAGIALAASLPVTRAQLFSGTSTEVNAVTGSGKQVTLQRSALQDLSKSLRGRLLLPGNEDYEKARHVLNPAINKFPALVVQPSGAADIRMAVDFARDNNLLLAVKCGGHSPSGKSTCDGGMQLDLSTFRHARVDPHSQTAYIAGGSLLGELDHESMAFDLATTAGTVSNTGVGGLTLGGGYGRLARRFGLALDNVKAVDIVTADGRLLHAGPDENQDLYWGVRGGGGNFGVVTSFEFKLHPLQRQVIGGDVVYPLRELRSLLRFYGDYCARAPDDMYLGFWAIVPPSGDGYVSIHACYSGPPNKADQLLAPIRKAGTVVSDDIKAVDYEVIQRSGDGYGSAGILGDYLKSGFMDRLTDELIDHVVAGIEPAPERTIQVSMQQCGGAVSRIPDKATAFAMREAQQNLLLVVSTPLYADPKSNIAYARKYWATLEPSFMGYYSNLVGNESQSSIDANYKGNFARLLEIKRKYDPRNLFRLNANIDPNVSEPRKAEARG
jgi:hypothetical protein